MDEWSQRQFIQENLEETALGTERRWQSATGRWANLQWEPSDLTPMQELFDEQQGALPELPLLAHLTGWEQGLSCRFQRQHKNLVPSSVCTGKRPWTRC